ncbi:MAG: AAA family ATPase [Bacillota bacterium]
MEKIQILIVNDNEEARSQLRSMLEEEQEFRIVGEAENGEEAQNKAKRLIPDIILMDDEMPGVDGLTATENIILNDPHVSIIMLSMYSSTEHLKRAMAAGAREYLVMPVVGQELVETIKRVNYTEKMRRHLGQGKKKSATKDSQIITVFGSKGGVGKTTLCVNLAAYLADKEKCKVVLVDLDLQFGDVPVFFNVVPRKSIAELVQEKGKLNIQLINNYLITHGSKVKILPAPTKPEYAELVSAESIVNILTVLKENYDYVLIDTPPYFQDTTLSALEISQQILLVMTLDLPAIKNMKLNLDLLHSLNQKSKSKLILNRATENLGISIKDVEESLDFLIAEKIPSDGKLVVPSVNKGMPFVLSDAKAKTSRAIDRVGKLVVNDLGYQKDLQEKNRKRSLFGKLFGQNKE